MRLKLTLRSGSEADDIAVSIDGTATVAQLAERLRVSHPRIRPSVTPGPDLCLLVHPGTSMERSLLPTVVIAEAGIRSGDSIALTNAPPASAPRQEVATLQVLSGPDAGRSFQLSSGTNLVGRDRASDVRLFDPFVSKRHLKVNVSDMVEVIDDQSANGVQIGAERVARAVVRSGDEVRIGDTVFSVTLHHAGASQPSSGHVLAFNRSPRLDPRYEGIELVAPEPPQRPEPRPFPLVTLVAPLLMGAVLYAVTRNALSIIFIALSPIMLLGSYVENRWAVKRATKQATAQFRAGLRDLALQQQYAAELEQEGRRRETPAVVEVCEGVDRLAPVLWTRRPEHVSFGQVRLGLGTARSRNTVKLPTTNNTTPELWQELHDVTAQFARIDRVPIVADLRTCGALAVAGPQVAALPLASGVVAQLVGLHSPAELVLTAILTPAGADRWEWLKWLPHTAGEHSPLSCGHLAATAGGITSLVGAVEELLAAREARDRSNDAVVVPIIVVLVDDDAATDDRARIVQLAERGPACGIHVLWTALSLERVPAACRAYLEVDPNSGAARAGFVQEGSAVTDLEPEPLDSGSAARLGRRLAPVVDAGAVADDQSDLPRRVSFLTLVGLDVAESPFEVIERWRGSNSLPGEPAAVMTQDNSLRALIGQSSPDRVHLDLRTHGPHALVGGTTGSGKSEFLQTWILAMAADHSPSRVNFLLVDYKGGTAFADCVDLPHCVGLVTDLRPHLVRRALRSLKAELRRREVILNAERAKDLLELERRQNGSAPPSLVIIVDEFAALLAEVPEFVEGVVDIAQRGRSLGLHLILATQRPAGVIKDSLRANTNLRIALRVADEEDSTDVVGSPVAASFDQAIPGRAVAKTGAGRLQSFQSAYVGGHTSSTPPPPSIEINELPFGLGVAWPVPRAARSEPVHDTGPTDIRRLVSSIGAAAEHARIPEPRMPWLPELTPTYRLEELPTKRTDEVLVFGVEDRPDDQAQPVVAFEPDEAGNMAVYGTGGSGKSTFLRALAVAAGFAPARGGPCHVYALDFGSRGLSMLEGLPHVGAVITGDDTERTARLIKMIRATIDERAERYAEVTAATIGEYRAITGQAGEPRILLLIDNFGAFRQAYEIGMNTRVFETLESIAADGRAVGVHVVATADQVASITASIQSVVQSHLALRLANDIDFTSLGVPPDLFSVSTPAGRGYMNGREVQVAVLGGDRNIAKQAAEVAKLSGAMVRAGMPPAPPVLRMPDRVLADSVPQQPGTAPVLGIWDETLEPITFEPTGVFVVSGPPQSGRTTTVVSLLQSIQHVRPGSPAVLFGPRRSSLANACQWLHQASTADEIETVATELSAKIKAETADLNELVVVIENPADLADGLADDAVLELVKTCRMFGQLVIVEGETSTLSSYSGFMNALKASKYGIALQPDQSDGDTVFNTDFPRVSRREFPLGRGLYVRSGRVHRVQVLMPE